MEGKRELRRSPRNNRSPKRRRNSLLPPTRSILKKSDDSTNFDILQDENTTTNILGSLWESNTTMFTRNFDETEITENGDGQRRRKSLGRRVSFASKARVRLFDKDEVTEKQPSEPNKSNPLNNGVRDEASDFMLAIPTPSPNDSMIENVESSSSTLRTQSEEDGKVEQHISPQKIVISSENQSMSQVQNSNMLMICYNTTLGPINDQHLPKNRDDTFASRDVSLVSMVGPTLIEYHDATSTSVSPRDMTLVSMVNQSPPSNREITNTSRDMTLVSIVNQSPPDRKVTCTSMGVRDMTMASMVGLSPSENRHTSMEDKDMTLASMVQSLSENNEVTRVDKDMTLASMVSQSPSEKVTRKSMNVKDMTLASIVDLSPSENREITCKSMDVKDMTLASIADLSPSENCKAIRTSMGVDDITMASLAESSSDDMSLVYEENVCQNNEQTNSQRSNTDLRSGEERETAFFDVSDVSLINEVNMTIYDGTAPDENIPLNMDIVTSENISPGDLNMEVCQKSDSVDTGSEEMKFMKSMIEEQNQQIELFEAELESMNKETQSLREKRDYLIKEKAEIEQKIRDAKRLVEETQCYTEKDLNEVQEQYRALITKHKWFPKKLTEELVYLVYDETLQVKIDIRDLHKRGDTEIPFVEVSLNLDDKIKPEEKLYYQAIFGGIQKFAQGYKGPIEFAQCSRIIKPITVYWENSKQLYRDYRVLRFKLPTDIISSQIIDNNIKIMKFRVNFFNYKAKTNFYIKFLFGWEDVISYPNISNLLWEIEPIYGKVNEPFVKETINKHFSNSILGCIRDACVVIQKSGFVF